jgi:hypothetical protein
LWSPAWRRQFEETIHANKSDSAARNHLLGRWRDPADRAAAAAFLPRPIDVRRSPDADDYLAQLRIWKSDFDLPGHHELPQLPRKRRPRVEHLPQCLAFRHGLASGWHFACSAANAFIMAAAR